MRHVSQVMLFLPLLLGYWYAHGLLSTWVVWVPSLFSERPWQLAGILLGTLLCGALAGLALAGPVRFLYQRNSVAIATAIASGAGAFEAFHLNLEAAHPFTRVALIMDLAAFILALPLCVVLLRRLRFNSSFEPTPPRDEA